MPPRNSLIDRLRYGRAWDEWDEGSQGDDETPVPAAAPSEAPRSRRRRAVVALTFAVLFVGGAAFSAAAGDQVRSMLEGQASDSAVGSDEGTTTTDTTSTTTEAAPPADTTGDAAAPTPAPAPAEDSAPTAPAPAAATPTAAPVTQHAQVAVAAKAAVEKAAVTSGSVTRTGRKSRPRHVTRSRMYVRTMRANTHRHVFPKREMVKAAPPELDGADPAGATVWLNRALPDPTPPALRLSPRFARHLLTVSRGRKADWALMLGVLRAEGHNGSAPANVGVLRSVAGRVAAVHGSGSAWATMFSLSSSPSFADRAVALSHYYRAVGLHALVTGLVAGKLALEKKVLTDPRVDIYGGGRGDIEAHRVNVRVLASIEYLADSFGQVSVSCLISGHRLYARPGVISAHIYGLAADISALGSVAIVGHQQPGSITEHAVRDLLLLPPELMPKQVISLIGLGGPSFPLANHYDHIHIGY
jgi:hypothetical protein